MTRGYVTNAPLMDAYNQAQQKWATTIRESDRVILSMIEAAKPNTLLDIGCSTGNLLRHIRRAFPEIALTGGDLVQSSLALARANVELAGVDLQVMDMLDIRGRYDCIVGNAVACCFAWPDYRPAIASIARALNPGGTYIAFEWLHPHQDLHIIETREATPDGLSIYFRNQELVREAFASSGMTATFRPFVMPFDLDEPGDPSNITSHTKILASGERLCFRGGLYQPWCHMTAHKSS